MNAMRRLDREAQARMLDLIGIPRYTRRGAVAPPTPSAEAAATPPVRRSPNPATTPSAQPTTTPTGPAAPRDVDTVDRPSLLAELGLDARTPRLLLFVESPRAPDPRGQLLLAAIRRLLPPHRMLDASDVPASWLSQAIALGGRIQAPADTQLHTAPALSSLRHDVAAKRALWRVIRRLRRHSAP